MVPWATPLSERPGGPLDVVVIQKAVRRSAQTVHISNNSLFFFSDIRGDTVGETAKLNQSLKVLKFLFMCYFHLFQSLVYNIYHKHSCAI